MNALVTGATGFIGSVLTRELISRGYRVRALVRPGKNAEALKDLGVEVCRGDLTDPATLQGICDHVDIVFHLAARVTDWGTKKQFYSSIYTATENLLREAANKSLRFVYVSSGAAMGLGQHLKGVKEIDPPRKSGIPYNDAKADAEELVRRFHDQGKIVCTIVRPMNVIGPGSVWVRDVVERMLKMFVPLFDHGRYSASLVGVDNLVEGIILAGTREIAGGKSYHFRDDWKVTWREYLTELGAYVGKNPRGNLPYRPAWVLASILESIFNLLRLRSPLTRLAVAVMGRDNDLDTTLARRELGWESRVSYREAMESIGEWVKQNYRQRRDP